MKFVFDKKFGIGDRVDLGIVVSRSLFFLVVANDDDCRYVDVCFAVGGRGLYLTQLKGCLKSLSFLLSLLFPLRDFR